MKNEVTAYGIFKALRESSANGLSEKGIALADNVDPTSENLAKIRQQLIDANHPCLDACGTRFWVAGGIQK